MSPTGPKRTCGRNALMSALRGGATQSHQPERAIITTRRRRFVRTFSTGVGSGSHLPERDSVHKFRDRWIPVALPPPARFISVVSWLFRSRNRGFPHRMGTSYCESEPPESALGSASPPNRPFFSNRPRRGSLSYFGASRFLAPYCPALAWRRTMTMAILGSALFCGRAQRSGGAHSVVDYTLGISAAIL
jgi:hypothetical protein